MHSSQSAFNAHPSRPHPKHRTSTSNPDHLPLKRLLATPGTGERSPLKAAFGLGGKDKSKEEKAAWADELVRQLEKERKVCLRSRSTPLWRVD